MKKIMLLALVVGLTANAFCQQDDHQLIDRANGNLVYLPQATEIHGSPFLNDEWTKANIITVNGVIFKNTQVKFDMYGNKFIYNKDGVAYELGPAVASVILFPDASDTTKKMVFKKGYAVNNIIPATKFVQVLVEGNSSLLKNYKMETEEYTEYGDATKHQRFKETEQYFVLSNSQYTQVTINKKNFESILQPKWSQMEPWLKKNNITGKDEKGWAAAFVYYNTL